jgi:heptosyltransferase-2
MQGPDQAVRVQPLRQKFFTECEPSPRGRPLCMEAITVDEVVASSAEMLSGKGR